MPFKSDACQPSDFIPLCVPEIRGNEWQYIKDCLDTNWVSSVGSYVDRFERSIADYVGAKYAIATTNGTAALHIALLVSGIQPDDEVLVSSLSFIAPANAIRYVGAYPVFMDADPTYWQMDSQKVIDFLTQKCRWHDGNLWNQATGRKVKAVLPVHILGHPVDLDPILEIAHQYELVVIEDAAESLGAKYKGHYVGNLADISCLSFNGNKLMTTGGGGAIVTNNKNWAEKARYLTTQAKEDSEEYIHQSIGYNYRLTNIQAAMGCAQIEQLAEFITAKQQTAKRYRESLSDVPGLSLPQEASWAESTFWLYTVLVDRARSSFSSRGIIKYLKSQKIQSRPLWKPIHQQEPYKSFESFCIENANVLYKNAISLPSSVGISKGNVLQISSILSNLAR